MIKNIIHIKLLYKNCSVFIPFGIINSIRVFLFFSFLFQGVLLRSQSPTVVLPTDGSSTQSTAPQGGFRYQRGFYLIQPNEMKASGLVMNDTINCIGFTIGAAQSDTTKGKFKVYLQNRA